MPKNHLPNPTAIRARYDAIAKWYDWAAQFTLAHRRDAVRELAPQNEARVLDLACGTGINFENILATDPNGCLVGLDYSAGILEQAHERVDNQRGNVCLCQGDAAQLPFANDAFDRVLCTFALKAIPRYLQAIDEVRRILKPSGIFVAMDAQLGEGSTRFLNPLMQWTARRFFYDLRRPLINEIVQRFQNVRTIEYDFGYTFLVRAQK